MTRLSVGCRCIRYGIDRRVAAAAVQRRIGCLDVAADPSWNGRARWLEAISRFGGTVSGAPDFAYRLCIERVPDGALQIARSKRLAPGVLGFGAHPVRRHCGISPRASARRVSISARCIPAMGWRRPRCLSPGAGRRGLRGRACGSRRIGRASPTELASGSEIVDADSRGRGPRIRIVAPAGHAVSDGMRVAGGSAEAVASPDGVGEIWFSGPSVADVLLEQCRRHGRRVRARRGQGLAAHGRPGFSAGRPPVCCGTPEGHDHCPRGRICIPRISKRPWNRTWTCCARAGSRPLRSSARAGEAIGIAAEIGNERARIEYPWIALPGRSRGWSRAGTMSGRRW